MACTDCGDKLSKYREEKEKLLAAIQQIQQTMQQYVRRLDMVNGALEVLEEKKVEQPATTTG